ncbi:MAG: FAD:protein FMN transferase [Treponema sp.]|nr:FAD:protein FMN transferase [Treponema sp.]
MFLVTCLPGAGLIDAQGEFVMGTYCRIDLFEDGSTALYNKLFTRLAELEKIFSANRDDSELAGVNRNAGLEAVEISAELFTVLERTLYFAEVTDGAFDPTVGPLVKLWGIGTENARIPLDWEIDAALYLVNWKELELTAGAEGNLHTSGTAFLKRKGMALDLGAIAKGYAADELTVILQEAGVKRAVINLGGNVYVWGKKDNGDPWNVGVQNPVTDRGDYIGILKLEGSISVVSSGIYERFFTGDDGKHYHHLLELTENGRGRRGYPAENGVLSTTVIAVSSMDADALSTSCFVLGYSRGMALALANGAEILYIEEKEISGSPGAMAIFTVTSH